MARASDADFNSVKYDGTLMRDPRYIASPFESWLSQDSYPEFSDWFRSDSGRNMHYTESIELTKTHDIDKNRSPVYRYFSTEFFPVNGRGFGAEGQRDLVTKALRNFG
jgi:hypothetical protein